MEEIDLIEFEMPTEESSIIKVIGVGGGGSNAVNHMYSEGIKDVSFIVCNTDNQALKKSPIQKKIQLGPVTTSGLGAGNNPNKAKEAAEESIEEIKTALSQNTKMVFITAGMGGGTGTGAAPVIAKIAKDLDILTVGIVTIPFAFEGSKKIAQALEGVRLMNENVDALLVINNERLRDIYPELDLTNAFAKADDVLKDAAKGIAEIITIHGHINVDFADVHTIMQDGGVAIMNTGFASGENRLRKAIDNALSSPLLKNNNVIGARKILMNFYCRQDDTSIKMDEITQINEFMDMVGDQAEQVIWGVSFDNDLEEEVKITLIATGFGVGDIEVPMQKPIVLSNPAPVSVEAQQEVLIEETLAQPEQVNKSEESVVETPTIIDAPAVVETPIEEEAPVELITLVEKEEGTSKADPKQAANDMFNEYYGDTKAEQKKKADNFTAMTQQIDDEKVVDELEKTPAYKRRQNTDGPKPYEFK